MHYLELKYEEIGKKLSLMTSQIQTMMAYGDGMAMPLIISMDTSGSTMAKYKGRFDLAIAQYERSQFPQLTI